MRRTTIKAGLLAAVATLTLAAAPAANAAPAEGTARPVRAAYFEFTDASRQTAVIKITDPATIQHARNLLRGTTQERPHVAGKIVKSPAPYNRKWSFHLDPASITFFELAIEVCDASIPYVEEHLDEVGGAFLPGNRWCPWSSRLVRELPSIR